MADNETRLDKARDVAQACRVALRANTEGSENFIIAAADTVMNRPSREIMNEVFPGVTVADDVPEFGTLLEIAKARRLLGYKPEYSWRDCIDENHVDENHVDENATKK